MTVPEQLAKLYTGIGLSDAVQQRSSNYLWVVGVQSHERVTSGRIYSPYMQEVIDRMVYRHYID